MPRVGQFDRAKVLAVCALLCAFASPGAARQRSSQGILEGRLLVDGAGRPLGGAVVYLEDHASTLLDIDVTDSTGAFRFRGVPLQNEGSLYFVVREEGFRALTERVDLRFYRGVFVLYLEPEVNEGPAAETTAPSPVVDLNQMLLEIPEEAERAVEEANELAAENRVAEAIEALERAVGIEPAYYDAWVKLGKHHMDLGAYADAGEAFGHAIDVNRGGAVAWLNMGILRYQESLDVPADENADDKLSDAQGYLASALALDPVFPTTHFYLGATLYRRGNYVEAEQRLRSALQLDPSMSDAHLMLMNVFVRMNRLEEALSESVRFLELAPDAPQKDAVEQIQTQIEAALGR